MDSKRRPSSKEAKRILKILYGKKCMFCESRGTKKFPLQYHHIIKFSDGGETNVDNGALLCRACHARLHKTKENENYYNTLIRRMKAGS